MPKVSHVPGLDKENSHKIRNVTKKCYVAVT